MSRDAELNDIAEQLEVLVARLRNVSEDRSIDANGRTPGHHLALARNRAGFTQQGLAEVSGVSTNTIVNFENGRSRPRPRTLMALAEPLGINWRILYEPEHE